jgi:hypothetical protein
MLIRCLSKKPSCNVHFASLKTTDRVCQKWNDISVVAYIAFYSAKTQWLRFGLSHNISQLTTCGKESKKNQSLANLLWLTEYILSRCSAYTSSGGNVKESMVITLKTADESEVVK